MHSHNRFQGEKNGLLKLYRFSIKSVISPVWNVNQIIQDATKSAKILHWKELSV